MDLEQYPHRPAGRIRPGARDNWGCRIRAGFACDLDYLEKITLVGEALGYSLIPSGYLHVYFILIGSGANGKSVLLGVLEELLGTHNVAALKPSQFNSAYQRAFLRGKLANIVSEIEVGTRLSDGIKALASGDMMNVEEKHKPPFILKPYATLWMGTNHFPRVEDISYGFVRRARVLTFNRRFEAENRDVHLSQKLRAELPGILNFALAGLARLYRNEKVSEPESCKQAMHRWLADVDQVSQFVDEVCKVGPGLEIETGILYRAFEAWAVSEGIQRRITHKMFTTRLESRGFGRVRRGNCKRMITGLTIERRPDDFYQTMEEQSDDEGNEN